MVPERLLWSLYSYLCAGIMTVFFTEYSGLRWRVKECPLVKAVLDTLPLPPLQVLRRFKFNIPKAQISLWLCNVFE